MSSNKLTDKQITERIGCGVWSLDAAESFGAIKQMQPKAKHYGRRENEDPREWAEAHQ